MNSYGPRDSFVSFIGMIVGAILVGMLINAAVGGGR